jgi:hypothetical protein
MSLFNDNPALEIRLFMDSSCREILDFKTCCGLKVFDQNLEIHVKNTGAEPITVPSRCDVESSAGTKRIRNLMPYGDHTLKPGEIIAFYCQLDETVWAQAEHIVFYDTQGRRYPAPVRKDQT